MLDVVIIVGICNIKYLFSTLSQNINWTNNFNYNNPAAASSSIQETVPLMTSTKPAGSGLLSTKIC